MHLRAHRHLTGLASAALVAACLSGCSGSDAPESDGGTPPSPAPGGASEPTAAEVTTRATIAQVVGEFDAKARHKLRDRVTTTIDGWLEAAYLGDYPRTEFGDAFTTFTPRARKLAERDRGLLSNATVGGELSGVEALNRRVRIDVLASDGKAVGVTARVRIRLRLTGDTDREEQIVGRVFLGYRAAAKGWQIFGYDLRRGEV